MMHKNGGEKTFLNYMRINHRDFNFEKKTIVEIGNGNNKVTINLLLNITKEDSSKIEIF